METRTERYQDRPKQKGQKRGHQGDWPPVEIVVLKSTDCVALGLRSNYIILTGQSSLSPGGILDVIIEACPGITACGAPGLRRALK